MAEAGEASKHTGPKPKQATDSAAAVLAMDDAGAQVLAEARGLTVEQLRGEALVAVRKHVGRGDLDAAELALCFTEGQVLGQIHRCRSSRSVLRRGAKAFGAGLLSAAALKVVVDYAKTLRMFEHDDLASRLDTIEGAVLERSE